MNNIQKAFEYAKEKHKNQKRKITGEPYINHIIDVANILKENGADEETITVGILHDTVEDTDATIQDIKEKFGSKIAKMIDCESEKKSLPYRERKAEHMARVSKSSYNTKLVNCADKVSNLKSLIKCYNIYNEQIWQYFNGSKEDIMWYYTLALKVLKDVSDKKMYEDFCKLYKNLFKKEIIYSNLLSNDEIIKLFNKIIPQNEYSWFIHYDIERKPNHTEIVAWSNADYQLSLNLYNNKTTVTTNIDKSLVTKKYLKEMYKLFGNSFKNDYIKSKLKAMSADFE